MSKYKYEIHNYHAVRDAEISIDGITVLAGINGCGKSTLSRWLYFLINGSCNYDQYLFEEFKERINKWLHRVDDVLWDIKMSTNDQNILEAISQINLSNYNDSINQIEYLSASAGKSSDMANVIFNDVLKSIENILDLYFSNDQIDTARKNRILSFFNVTHEQEGANEIKELDTQVRRWFDDITFLFVSNVNKRTKDSFFELLQRKFIKEDIPLKIYLKEDDVNIIEEDRISAIFNLHRAIYIDTPMAITSNATNNIFWKDLRDKMLESGNIDLSETRKLLRRINLLLDGEASLTSDDVVKKKELRYVSNDKTINIPLNETATGFKTFSYIQRLLENGYLANDTLLMIDEPEAHLHPQWIVDFARLLVLLHKEIGVKILIASHNPDMVAAIQAIARKENVLENTNFYLAKSCNDNTHQFTYKNLGPEIGEIFESFNIAIDRIKFYGA